MKLKSSSIYLFTGLIFFITSFMSLLNHVSTRIKHTRESTAACAGSMHQKGAFLQQKSTKFHSYSIPLHYVVCLPCSLFIYLCRCTWCDVVEHTCNVLRVLVHIVCQPAQGKPIHPQSTQLWHFFEEKSIRFTTQTKRLACTPQGNY